MFWLLSFFIFSLFFFTQFREHAYYLTPLIIFSSLMNAYGAEKILAIDKVKYFSYFLIILVPIVMIGRVYHRWDETKQVPDELLYKAENINSYIPKKEMVLIFGDKSPVIYLYYLNRKGVVINNLNQITINKYKVNGFKFIVGEFNKTELILIKRLGAKLIKKINNFYIFSII